MTTSLIEIDGAQGEGGGQVFRTSVSLAILTGQALSISNIRAGRKRPGLMRQHLTALRAAAAISNATMEGAELGSSAVRFTPGSIRAGEHHHAVGTAGSTTLILQTVLFPLLAAPGHSRLVLEGGTHNPMAPPFEFLERCYLPLLRSMGARIEARLVRYGFFPAGGGRIEVEVEGGQTLKPLDLVETPPVRERRAQIYHSQLPRSIAEREKKVLLRKLNWNGGVEIIEIDSQGPGNVICVEVDRGSVREVVTSFGAPGTEAKRVASAAAIAMNEYLAADMPVGVHLADQLILPLALAGGGRFATLEPSLHTTTNMAVVERFVSGRFHRERDGARHVIEYRS